MHSDSSSFSQSLEALKELFHSLRTPLGVALTIAKDNKNQLPLSPDDYNDAVNALEKIRDHLDELKPLLNLGALKCVELDLSEVISICELEGFEFNPVQSEIIKVEVEVSLLKKWLQSCYKTGSNKNYLTVEIGTERVALIIQTDITNSSQLSSTFQKLLSAACKEIGAKLEVLPEKSKLYLPRC